MPLYLTIGKGLLAYGIIRLVAHLIGVRRVSQVSVLELTLLNSLAIVVAIGALAPAFSLGSAAIICGLWLGLLLLERYALTRSRAVRQSLQGDPVMLIYHGKILEHNLHRKRISAEQLLSKLRTQSIFDLAEVDMAVLEPDGTLSVLRNPQSEPLTRQDALVAGRYTGMPIEVIVDGKIIHERLAQRGLTEKWLRDHLRAFGVEFASEVALATVDENGQLYVDKYDDRLDQRSDLHKLAGKANVRGYANLQPLQEPVQSNAERAWSDYQLRKAEKEDRPHVPKQK